MFEGEKAGWDSLFKYYQDRFLEEIGICFAYVKNKKFRCEIDFFVGEKTNRVLGMRLYQELDIDKKNLDKEEENKVVYYDFALSDKNEIGKLLFKKVVEKPVNEIEDNAEKDPQEELIEVKVFSEDGTSDSNIACVKISPKDFPNEILYFSDVSYD